MEKGNSLKSATQEIHPNTSSKLPSNNNIPHSTEKSTETAKKVSTDGKVVQMSLKDGANQQTSDDIDELMRDKILSRSAFAEQETEAVKEAPKETPRTSPSPRRRGTPTTTCTV